MAQSRGGIRLTPQQFNLMWINAPHRLNLALWNFEVEVGKMAVSIFKGSFGRKAWKGKAWAPRSKNTRGAHPLMVETGTLKNSIKWKLLGGGIGKSKGVRVYTDPAAFGGAARHKGFCSAAVHNQGLPIMAFGKYSTTMPQRQFMGDDSGELNMQIRSLTNKYLNIRHIAHK